MMFKSILSNKKITKYRKHILNFVIFKLFNINTIL